MDAHLDCRKKFRALFFTLEMCECLRIAMLDVPETANQGDSVELSCIYDLDNVTLYSIKWYKNDIEFYRYVPNDWPPGQFLPLPGVSVDLSKSGKQSVYLRNVDLNSTGTYRCEVSAEAPSFQSVEAERDMNVMVLPTEGPKITGGQNRYNVGDVVAINCTSAKSKPAATLRWYINDHLVGPEFQTEHSTTLHEDGLETSSLSLKFVAKEKHFINQNMRLKCTASITKDYVMSNEEMFVGGRQQSSTLQINENESREKPIKGAASPKRKGVKLSQSSKSGCADYFLHWFLLFSVMLLHIRIT
ncbi:cell adhesion molecule 3-like isoform X3 [Stegodyphus dumicola]|uniref:cell adhesion molecule 3-like isoform X3 n=1 Tax=Stegodyphus dumicola TaxID=202533 RepID=UPI0015B2960E|nr:cell adhesion molecule 3-like isoform X3 [Stegodyphus dumicola]